MVTFKLWQHFLLNGTVIRPECFTRANCLDGWHPQGKGTLKAHLQHQATSNIPWCDLYQQCCPWEPSTLMPSGLTVIVLKDVNCCNGPPPTSSLLPPPPLKKKFSVRTEHNWLNQGGLGALKPPWLNQGALVKPRSRLLGWKQSSTCYSNN